MYIFCFIAGKIKTLEFFGNEMYSFFYLSRKEAGVNKYIKSNGEPNKLAGRKKRLVILQKKIWSRESQHAPDLLRWIQKSL